MSSLTSHNGSRARARVRGGGAITGPVGVVCRGFMATMMTRFGSGRTLLFADFGLQICCMKHTEGQKNVHGTSFDTRTWNCMIVVLWQSALSEKRESALTGRASSFAPSLGAENGSFVQRSKEAALQTNANPSRHSQRQVQLPE